MCGIVAYVGYQPCRDFIIQGLSRLEYRGYDAAGFVCTDRVTRRFSFAKEVGQVQKLSDLLQKLGYDGCAGMGHTRWATHGRATDLVNAHPQFDCQNTLAVVHNGIIEGYSPIRDKLIAEGHVVKSCTDTEVVAHLVGEAIVFHKTIVPAFVHALSQLKGAYAMVFMIERQPDILVLVRRRSPLAIGIGDNEMFVSSDPMVFADKTDKVIFMPDETFAIISKSHIDLYDFAGNQLSPWQYVEKFSVPLESLSGNGYEHFMLKEIYEQKRAIERTITFFRTLHGHEPETYQEDRVLPAYTNPRSYGQNIWSHVGIAAEDIKSLKSLHMLGAGTSWHAARIGQFFFEEIAKIPTSVHLASEFRYMPYFKPENGMALFITQSGETADTLEALRMVSRYGIQTVALTNVASSTIVREADGFFLMQAGPEISVASTKAFSAQVSSLYWLAHRIALERGIITSADLSKAEEQLLITAELLESTIEQYKHEITTTDAPFYAKYGRCIFLGRHVSYPFALEAALKLKEISYIFSQGYPAGELKHGPIALIDEFTPVVLFSVLNNVVYDKLVSNAQEVKARGGHLVVFAIEGQDELIKLADRAYIVPRVEPLLVPLAMTGIMQFWAYQITRVLGLPIDRPRNLAKSVTVE